MDLEMIGIGATAKVYRDGDVAIKLYDNSSVFEVEGEAKLQTYAMETGLPVPEIFGVKRVDTNQVVLEMVCVAGIPLLNEEMGQEEILKQLRILVKLQCDIHAKDAQMLPKQKDRLTKKINQNPDLEDEIKNQIFTLLDKLDDGTLQLCHGDFHPLNVLFDGKKHWIIDWVDATAGNPLADACRTYILLKQFATQLSVVYLSCFCEEVGVSSEAILAWLPIIIAARLSEDMDDNARKMLMNLLQDALERI